MESKITAFIDDIKKEGVVISDESKLTQILIEAAADDYSWQHRFLHTVLRGRAEGIVFTINLSTNRIKSTLLQSHLVAKKKQSLFDLFFKHEFNHIKLSVDSFLSNCRYS